MKLTYWHCQHKTDADCYSIRERTKKEALRMIREHWCKTDFDVADLKKVTIEYKDGFDLMQLCLTESAGCWEYQS